MRTADNPLKGKAIKRKSTYHRVIVPVHIPALDGYYETSLKVFMTCFSSILKTSHDETAITVVDDASCKEVHNELYRLLKEGAIDELIVHDKPKGKIASVAKAFRASNESLVTICDADVLFLPGWQSSVEKIFVSFPKVGMVSPLPLPNLDTYCSAWSFYWGLTRFRLKSCKSFDPKMTAAFFRSLGGRFESKRAPLGIVNRGSEVLALIGSGHFCATYRNEIRNFIPESLPDGPWTNEWEREFLDLPIQAGGYMRLATSEGYVYHMGNSFEPWMSEELRKIPHFVEKKLAKGLTTTEGFFHKLPLRSIISRILLSSSFRKIILRLHR